MKDLSIVIVNINNCKVLQECLKSIYQSTHELDFEIIVSDNGSSDGSQKMVRESFPAVKLIENKENWGFSAASNQGLRLADARYCLLLNNDTIVKEAAFNKMIDFMDTHPEAGASGPKLSNLDGTPQQQGGRLGKKFWLSKRPIAVDFVIGAALLVKRVVIEKVGLMDENLFFYNDDLDWCMSIRKAGWKVYFLPQAEIMHYGGYSSRRRFSSRLFVEGFKGGLYFCRKHYGELAYNLYRFFLCLFLSVCLPFLIRDIHKLKAYTTIISIAYHGQIPRPMVESNS